MSTDISNNNNNNKNNGESSAAQLGPPTAPAEEEEQKTPNASIVAIPSADDSQDTSRDAALEPSRHCSFCLLAEFDIDKGSTLSHQYPQPTGYDEHMLAELMLPDGAHARVEDWTIFFLKTQRPQVKSRQSQDTHLRKSSTESGWSSDGLTYVINLVRTKHDTSVRRGALVKSMAIGTRHPYIDIFKPALLLALDDYFKEPKIECLARLYDAINQLDLSVAPTFSRAEKLILRASDRRDLFEERFIESDDSANTTGVSEAEVLRQRTDSTSTASEEVKSIKKKQSSASLRPTLGARRGSSAASMVGDRRPSQLISPLPTKGRPRDTHFYDTTIAYRSVSLPIRVPLTTFPEEVGEYSLIKLIQTFSGSQSTPLGPMHPHLHTNGTATHPIILLFNALITQKRVIFLGHGQPANLVASFVLAACALGSGCGAVFRGFAARAFPYTNLMNLDELEKVPGYIAGVTNPRFEDLHAWDVLLNVETGKVQVAKDIAAPPPMPINPRPAMTRDAFSNGSISSMAGTSAVSHDVNSKTSLDLDGPTTASSIKSGVSGRDRSNTVFDTRFDSPNNLFMEDITNAIQTHYGERYIRARITDFVSGFARAVARHEEHFYGHTSMSAMSQPYLNGQLGSGPVYPDRDTELKEIQSNQVRAEGFRHTIAYRLYKKDELEATQLSLIRSFDPSHQIARLRRARTLSPGESDLIFETISKSVKSYDEITELLSLLPLHAGGLLPLGFGLFHPNAQVRMLMVDFFISLCNHPIGWQLSEACNFNTSSFITTMKDEQVKNVLSKLSLIASEPSLEKATPLLSSLKGYNRRIHLSASSEKELVGETRAKVDTARLALQNLEYEKNMLIAEIKRCMEFKSIYGEVDLPTLKEFRAVKGEEWNGHQEMVQRFQFELEERQRYEAEKQELQRQKANVIKQNKDKKALLEAAEMEISNMLTTTQSLESKLS